MHGAGPAASNGHGLNDHKPEELSTPTIPSSTLLDSIQTVGCSQPPHEEVDNDKEETEETVFEEITGSGEEDGRLAMPCPETSECQDFPAGQIKIKGLSHHKRTVQTMKDNFDFFKHALEEISDVGEPVTSEYRSTFNLDPARDFTDIATLHQTLSNFSLSTSYSGIGAPETTLHLLRHTMAELYGTTPVMPQIHFQIEYDEACREELLLFEKLPGSGGQDTCLFGDLCDFFVDDLQDTVKDLLNRPELALEVLAKMVVEGQAVKTHAFCFKHGKHCQLHPGFNSTHCFEFVLKPMNLCTVWLHADTHTNTMLNCAILIFINTFVIFYCFILVIK